MPILILAIPGAYLYQPRKFGLHGLTCWFITSFEREQIINSRKRGYPHVDSWQIILISAVSTVVTNLVIQPIMAAYSAEKGKNLARKEDLNKLVVEMKALTTAQEEIKAELSGDLWHRQQRYNEKREVYGTLLKTANELSNRYRNLAEVLNEISRTQQSAAFNQKLVEEMKKDGDQIHVEEANLRHGMTMGRIFAGPYCFMALNKYFRTHKEAGAPMTELWAINRSKALVVLVGELIESAWKDLGIIAVEADN